MADVPLLSAIYIYPIKSCRGIAVPVAQLNQWGLQYDRNWLVVTPEGRFLTQRELPELALVETAIETDQNRLHLRFPGAEPLHLPLLPQPGSVVEVVVWKSHCQAVDQGEEAAAWFSRCLDRPCRLVRIGDSYNRPVVPEDEAESAQVSFADAYPLLLISEASLNDLNQRLPEALPMNRFRPNLVVSGCQPFAEDQWQSIQVGQARFDLVKPCERCVITTTDQTTAIRSKDAEPLKTLATYRRVAKGGVIFGQNLIHREGSEVRVGSNVKVLQE